MYTRVYSGMSPVNSVELWFPHQFGLNKGKGVVGFWAGRGKLWEEDQEKDDQQVA